jgi:hypothetical protein
MDLNHARLPIPPLRHGRIQRVLDGQQSLVSQSAYIDVKPPEPSAKPPSACRLHPNGASALRKGLGMTEKNAATQTPMLQSDAKEIRRITHDINNALEIIIQANYLVNTTALTDQAKEWMKLLDHGLRQATDLTRQLREFVHSRS